VPWQFVMMMAACGRAVGKVSGEKVSQFGRRPFQSVRFTARSGKAECDSVAREALEGWASQPEEDENVSP
jgi:hypothetical protein